MATQTADKTGFKPKAIVKKLMVALPERSRIVLESRFGLGTSAERVTLARPATKSTDSSRSVAACQSSPATRSRESSERNVVESCATHVGVRPSMSADISFASSRNSGRIASTPATPGITAATASSWRPTNPSTAPVMRSS